MTKIAQGNKFSAEFRRVRELLGLTQQGLADRLQLSQNYVAQIEMGRKQPSGRVLSALANVERESIASGNYPEAIANDPTVGEQGFSGFESVDVLQMGIEHHFRSLLGAAGDDVGRLGWISEQMKQHVSIPASWKQPATAEKSTKSKLGQVSLPSEHTPLSSETGLPLPSPSRRSQTA